MDITKFISAATGWGFDTKEATKTGERISNIRQSFAVREGIKPEQTRIAGDRGRVLGYPPLNEGPTAGVTVDSEELKEEFFKAMDWNIETGKPSLGKLKELGLDDVAQDLWS
jgi:aldehyde:ferredoxin oxidoreductase